MNQKEVTKREVLEYNDFLKKIHDCDYKPLSPQNQSEDGLAKSGISKIKREPAYDFVGYADAVFNNQSKIDVPGFRSENGMTDAGALGSEFNSNTSESITLDDVIIADYDNWGEESK